MVFVETEKIKQVADFGLSKATSGNSLNSKVGSLNWCAPEILLQSAPYTKAGDVYSFGMVILSFFSFFSDKEKSIILFFVSNSKLQRFCGKL